MGRGPGTSTRRGALAAIGVGMLAAALLAPMTAGATSTQAVGPACAAIPADVVQATFGQPTEGLDVQEPDLQGFSQCVYNVGAKHCPDEGALHVLFTDRSKEAAAPPSLKALRKDFTKQGKATTPVKAKGLGKGAFILGHATDYRISILARTKAVSVQVVLDTTCVQYLSWIDGTKINAQLTALAKQALKPAK